MNTTVYRLALLYERLGCVYVLYRRTYIPSLIHSLAPLTFYFDYKFYYSSKFSGVARGGKGGPPRRQK